MKKTYISPVMLTVELGSRDALLTLSANDSLGVNDGGTTSDHGVTSGDVKENSVSNVNVWDKEW